MAAFALAWRPVRFALALGAIFLAGELDASRHGTTLEVSRNFFGTLRVTRTADGYLNLVHGTTQHGRQKIDDADRPAPRMYYHRKGPLGRLFAALPPERRQRVGVVGLGCGAMAAYADAGQTWTFFEIDPDVVRLAQDERYFTFLARCPASWSIVVGDARRQLVRSADASFDLLVLDAFSSDAIPAHLLTREAFALYRAKLAPGGVLAFHVSNRYLDLPPLLARLAAEANLLARYDEDTAVSDAEKADGKAPSAWVFLSADAFGSGRYPWRVLKPAPGPIWADDFSNLLALWKKADD